MRGQGQAISLGRVIQWGAIIVLTVVGLLYFGLPAQSQDRPSWSAELWATEEGEQLVAAVRSFEPEPEAFAPTLAVLCGLTLRYDPGPASDPDIDWTGRSVLLAFDFGGSTIERELRYEAMDGMFAMSIGANDALLDAIRAGAQVTVRLPDGGLPENTFSLSGSTAAIAEMRRNCRR